MPPLTEKRNVFHPTIPEDRSDDETASQQADFEKKDGAFIGETEVELDHSTVDPFVPFGKDHAALSRVRAKSLIDGPDDLPDEPKRIITIRAVVLGCMCGAAVNASNIYLGLKTGWTFGALLLGSVGVLALSALVVSVVIVIAVLLTMTIAALLVVVGLAVVLIVAIVATLLWLLLMAIAIVIAALVRLRHVWCFREVLRLL